MGTPRTKSRNRQTRRSDYGRNMRKERSGGELKGKAGLASRRFRVESVVKLTDEAEARREIEKGRTAATCGLDLAGEWDWSMEEAWLILASASPDRQGGLRGAKQVID